MYWSAGVQNVKYMQLKERVKYRVMERRNELSLTLTIRVKNRGTVLPLWQTRESCMHAYHWVSCRFLLHYNTKPWLRLFYVSLAVLTDKVWWKLLSLILELEESVWSLTGCVAYEASGFSFTGTWECGSKKSDLVVNFLYSGGLVLSLCWVPWWLYDTTKVTWRRGCQIQWKECRVL